MAIPLIGPVLNFAGKFLGGGIIGDIFGGIKDHFAHKRQLKQQKQLTELKIEERKMDMIVKQATHDIDWSLIMAEASKTSWKDELWTIIFAGIFVAVFIPPLQPYVKNGLAILAGMDGYMQAYIGTAIGAAFGVAELRKWRGK